MRYLRGARKKPRAPLRQADVTAASSTCGAMPRALRRPLNAPLRMSTRMCGAAAGSYRPTRPTREPRRAPWPLQSSAGCRSNPPARGDPMCTRMHGRHYHYHYDYHYTTTSRRWGQRRPATRAARHTARASRSRGGEAAVGPRRLQRRRRRTKTLTNQAAHRRDGISGRATFMQVLRRDAPCQPH